MRGVGSNPGDGSVQSIQTIVHTSCPLLPYGYQEGAAGGINLQCGGSQEAMRGRRRKGSRTKTNLKLWWKNPRKPGQHPTLNTFFALVTPLLITCQCYLYMLYYLKYTKLGWKVVCIFLLAYHHQDWKLFVWWYQILKWILCMNKN